MQIDSPPKPDERWESVQRIAASATFRRSPRLRDMLLYIAEQSLSGHEQELTEMKIGVRVFARGEDYVPSEDSIVRSTVRQLRTKLHEYYETDGAVAPWIMEIPKGGFVATFRHRDEVADERSSSADVQLPPNRSWWQSRVLLVSLGLLLAVSILANLWLWLAPSRTGASHSRAPGLAAWLITSTNQPTHVVLDDYAYVLMSTSMPAPPSVEDYAQRSYISLSRSSTITDPIQATQTGIHGPPSSHSTRLLNPPRRTPASDMPELRTSQT
jgi:hypothetical protein